MYKFEYGLDLDSETINKLMKLKCTTAWAVYSFSVCYERSTEQKCTYKIIKDFFEFPDKKLQKILTKLHYAVLINRYTVTDPDGKVLDDGLHIHNGLEACPDCRLYTITKGCYCDPEVPIGYKINLDHEWIK